MAGQGSKQIGDRLYSFGTIPATEAVRLQILIVKAIGEPLFKAASTGAGIKTKEGQEQLAASAVSALVSNLNEDDTVRLIATAMKYVSLQDSGKVPERANLDTHFTGRNRELWQVVFGVLVFNFSDFFPESLLNSLRAKAGSLLE